MDFDRGWCKIDGVWFVFWEDGDVFVGCLSNVLVVWFHPRWYNCQFSFFFGFGEWYI